jgi:hypothetical protein
MLLRRQRTQDKIEGRSPGPWRGDDYAAVDGDRRFGRIYRTQAPGGAMIWRWFLQGPHPWIPAGVRSNGSNEGLHEAMRELAAEYGKACARFRGD